MPYKGTTCKAPGSTTRQILASTRRDAIKAARDLHYNEEVITKLRETNSIHEIGNIMKTARRNGFND